MVVTLFIWFSYGFPTFPLVFLWISHCSYGFPMDFPLFLWFSYGFATCPMVFLWISHCSYGFPMDFPLFLWFSYGFATCPMVFLWICHFSYGFPWLNRSLPMFRDSASAAEWLLHLVRLLLLRHLGLHGAAYALDGF